MVKSREEQISGITILDEDGYGYVNASGTIINNLDSIELNKSSSVPGGDPLQNNGKLWVKNDNPSSLMFTDGYGNDVNLTAGVASGLNNVLLAGNQTNGTNIALTNGSAITNVHQVGFQDIYINDITGLDSNNGTSAGTPIKTIEEAVKRVGVNGIMRDTRFYVYPHSTSIGYDISSIERINGYPGGSLSIIGVGETVAIASSTVNAVSDGIELTIFPNPGWTVDIYRGMHIEFLTATNSGIVGGKRTILRNTNNKIWISSPFVSNISPGDTFKIIRPSVRFNTPGQATIISGGMNSNLYIEPFSGNGLNFVNVEFSDTASSGVFFSGKISMFGVVFRNTNSYSLIEFSDCNLSFSLSVAVDFSNIGVNQQSSVGWGASSLSDGTYEASSFVFTRAACSGFISCSNVYLYGSKLNIYGSSYKSNFDCITAQHSQVTLEYVSFPSGATKHIFDITGSNHLTKIEDSSSMIVLGKLETLSGIGDLKVYENSFIVLAPAGGIEPIITGAAISQGNGSSIKLLGVSGSSVNSGFRAGRSSGDFITQSTFAIGEMISAGGALIERDS